MLYGLKPGDTIATDIDEVLIYLLDPFVKNYNSIHQTNFKREDFFTYNWWEVLGISKQRSIEEYQKFMENPASDDLPLIQGSLEGVRALAEVFSINAVTFRAKEVETKTNLQISQFSGYLNQIVFGSTSLVSWTPNSKGKITKSLDSKLIIEDSLSAAYDCLNHGIPSVLLDYPWNQDDNLPEGILRVKTWDEILDKILS